MNILGIIPARGGSKGIPRKNIALLAGKPLLSYTCQAALGSLKLNRVILNTDDQEIAELGRNYGVDAPFLRPENLAGDDIPILPVISHTLRWLEKEQGYTTDLIVLLQPTSPFRRSDHIDSALDTYLNSDADTLVSVEEVPHNLTPSSLMKIDEQGYLHPLLEGELVLRRQEKPKVYARNGPSILIVRRSVIDRGHLYGDKVLPFKMSRLASLDIDDQDDLILAESMMRYNQEME